MAVRAPTGSPLVPPRPEGQTWGLWSFALARAVSEALEDPDRFRESVDRLAAAVAELGAACVAGASDEGRRLALGVASILGLPIWSEGSRHNGRLVVVDAVVNTGVQVAWSMLKAREGGLTDIVGVGLVAQASALADRIEAGDQVQALEVV